MQVSRNLWYLKYQEKEFGVEKLQLVDLLQSFLLQFPALALVMSDYYFEFGELIDGLDSNSLSLIQAKRTFRAVELNPAFKLLELRRIPIDLSEVLIVECKNDEIWSRNRVGIRTCERFALHFFPDAKYIPEVRALRKNFPDAAHQNHVCSGEPKSLCLYLETWSTLERTWTPEKHLNRILYWLTETANETLHLDDQPIEQIYFESKFELVLPADFDTKVGDNNYLLKALPRLFSNEDKKFTLLVASFIPVTQAKKVDIPTACLVLTLQPIVHGGVEQYPNSLGELHDQLAARGSPVASILFKQIKELAGTDGLDKTNAAFTLLVLRIPITRQEGEDPERIDLRGFAIKNELGDLGVAGDVLIEIENVYQRFEMLNVNKEPYKKWRDIPIEPIACLLPFTRKYARQAAGIIPEGPRGVLAGVGALGSGMVNIWHREGWGTWTLINPDYVKPHNLARHEVYESQVGNFKVHAVNNLFHCLYNQEETCGSSISEDACNFQNGAVSEAIKSNEIIVDATTTLEFPRDLSTHKDVKRAVSVFLTPSGLGSVMLMEDSVRNITLDILEAQYYRAIIGNTWGTDHLAGSYGYLRVGGGCREVSVIISTELINLHVATLARQVRLMSERSEALIRLWHSNPETGELCLHEIFPTTPRITKQPPWQVIWNEAIRTTICNYRQAALPNETGGILLGYFDLKLMRIYIVDALPAPADSIEEKDGFTRGKEGLIEIVQSAQKKTANIVGYIGEWHSHPTDSSTKPSGADLHLLRFLAQQLQQEGLPALMLIMGETEENLLSEGQLP